TPPVCSADFASPRAGESTRNGFADSHRRAPVPESWRTPGNLRGLRTPEELNHRHPFSSREQGKPQHPLQAAPADFAHPRRPERAKLPAHSCCLRALGLGLECLVWNSIVWSPCRQDYSWHSWYLGSTQPERPLHARSVAERRQDAPARPPTGSRWLRRPGECLRPTFERAEIAPRPYRLSWRRQPRGYLQLQMPTDKSTALHNKPRLAGEYACFCNLPPSAVTQDSATLRCCRRCCPGEPRTGPECSTEDSLS